VATTLVGKVQLHTDASCPEYHLTTTMWVPLYQIIFCCRGCRSLCRAATQLQCHWLFGQHFPL